MGRKRGRGRGSFIDSVISAVDSFYGEVMQNLKGWSAPAPRLREPIDHEAESVTSVVSADALGESQSIAPYAAEVVPPGTEQAPSAVQDQGLDGVIGGGT